MLYLDQARKISKIGLHFVHSSKAYPSFFVSASSQGCSFAFLGCPSGAG